MTKPSSYLSRFHNLINNDDYKDKESEFKFLARVYKILNKTLKKSINAIKCKYEIMNTANVDKMPIKDIIQIIDGITSIMADISSLAHMIDELAFKIYSVKESIRAPSNTPRSSAQRADGDLQSSSNGFMFKMNPFTQNGSTEKHTKLFNEIVADRPLDEVMDTIQTQINSQNKVTQLICATCSADALCDDHKEYVSDAKFLLINKKKVFCVAYYSIKTMLYLFNWLPHIKSAGITIDTIKDMLLKEANFISRLLFVTQRLYSATKYCYQIEQSWHCKGEQFDKIMHDIFKIANTIMCLLKLISEASNKLPTRSGKHTISKSEYSEMLIDHDVILRI